MDRDIFREEAYLRSGGTPPESMDVSEEKEGDVSCISVAYLREKLVESPDDEKHVDGDNDMVVRRGQTRYGL